MNLSEVPYQPALPVYVPPPNVLSPAVVPHALREPAVSAELLALPKLLPSLPPNEEFVLSIEMPAFDWRLTTSVCDMQVTRDYREVVFESLIDNAVLVRVTLQTEHSDGVGSDLRINNVSLKFHVTNHKSRTHFITDTLYALLGLGGPVSLAIPNININLKLDFTIPTQEISNFLQLRQLEFGLLVIEKAYGVEFEIPQDISGAEMNSIALAYHALVEREFNWRVNEIIQPTPATAEMLAWFDSLKPTESNGSLYRLMFGPSVEAREILGVRITLGQQTLFIDDAVIENREMVRCELAKNDGHIVPITIRPKSRKGRYSFSNTPQFREEMFDSHVRTLIAVDDLLNKKLAARYHHLAALSLADFSHQEVSTIIARPELDEDAYLIRDE